MRRLLAAAALAAGTMTMTGVALAPSGAVNAWGLKAKCDKVINPEGQGFYTSDGELLIGAKGHIAWPEGGKISGIWWDGVTVDENGRPVPSDSGGASVPTDCTPDTTTTTTTEPETTTTTTEPETTTTAETTTTVAPPPTDATTTTAAESTTTLPPPASDATTSTTIAPPPDNSTPDTPVYTCVDFGTNYDLADQWRQHYVAIGRSDLAAALTDCRPATTTKGTLPATGTPAQNSAMVALVPLGLGGLAFGASKIRRRTR